MTNHRESVHVRVIVDVMWTGVGVTVAQAGQGEQRLPARFEVGVTVAQAGARVSSACRQGSRRPAGPTPTAGALAAPLRDRIDGRVGPRPTEVLPEG